MDMKPKRVKNSDIMSTTYSKPLRESKKPEFTIGDSVRNLKYDLPFGKGDNRQNTKEFLEIVAIAAQKPPT